MAARPTNRQRASLETLQQRYGPNRNQKRNDSDDILTKLFKNHNAQQTLSEWQVLLRSEQRALMQELNQTKRP